MHMRGVVHRCTSTIETLHLQSDGCQHFYNLTPPQLFLLCEFFFLQIPPIPDRRTAGTCRPPAAAAALVPGRVTGQLTPSVATLPSLHFLALSAPSPPPSPRPCALSTSARTPSHGSPRPPSSSVASARSSSPTTRSLARSRAP
jgi:hypothetical protein